MDVRLPRMAVSRTRKFLEPILEAADGWRRKVLPEFVKGILCSGSMIVTEIARHSKKPQETLEAQRKSLEHHLTSDSWDQEEHQMVLAHERRIGSWVEKLTPIWADPGDLVKLYAEKMEHLGRVRDGDESSRRGETVTEPGYWLWQSFAGVNCKKDPVPLVNFVFSLQDPDFKSFNVAWQIGLKRIAQATHHNGVVIIDRGGDADVIFQELQANQLHFMIRLVGARYVEQISSGQTSSVHALARRVGLWGHAVLKEKIGPRKHPWSCSFGYTKVRLPGQEQDLTLIVTLDERQREPHERYRYFLTDVPIEDDRMAIRLLEMYVGRWKAEEAARFLKSDLGQETVRTLSFRAIRRLITMLYWVMALVAFVMNDLQESTLVKLRTIGLSLMREIEFLFYGIRRGLARLLGETDPISLILPEE